MQPRHTFWTFAETAAGATATPSKFCGTLLRRQTWEPGPSTSSMSTRRQVTTALGMKDHFEELEPGSDLEQYYQGGLDMYAHRYVVPYDKESVRRPNMRTRPKRQKRKCPLCASARSRRCLNGLELRLRRRRLCCFREGCAQRDPDRHKHRRRHRTALIKGASPEASVSPCRPTTASWRTVRRSATTAFSRISGASRRYQARLPGKMPFF